MGNQAFINKDSKRVDAKQATVKSPDVNLISNSNWDRLSEIVYQATGSIKEEMDLKTKLDRAILPERGELQFAVGEEIDIEWIREELGIEFNIDIQVADLADVHNLAGLVKVLDSKLKKSNL